MTKGEMIHELKKIGVKQNSDFIPLYKLTFAEVAQLYGEKVGF